MQTHTPDTQHTEGPFPLGQTHRLFIGSEWVDTQEHIEIRFPYDRRVLVGRDLQLGGADPVRVGRLAALVAGGEGDVVREARRRE